MYSGVTFDGSAWQGYSTGADDLSVTLILFLTPTEGLSFVSEPFVAECLYRTSFSGLGSVKLDLFSLGREQNDFLKVSGMYFLFHLQSTRGTPQD